MQWGYFPANRSGKGLQSFTTDSEIMRGDLCRLLYDATRHRCKYLFGIYIQLITQAEDFAEALFSDGSKDRFDLVVGADGQGSRTRRMMLDANLHTAADPFHPLGMCAGYFMVNQEAREQEAYNATAFFTTRHRSIMTRRHDPHAFQAYLMCDPDSSERLKNTNKGDVDEEKKTLAKVFRGAGWETEQILKALRVADDFYCERVGVVKMDHWSSGRIALLGDAAYCPSAMTGMGTSSSIVGAYVLAGEIGKSYGKASGITIPKDGLATALETYEKKLRPFMNQVQKGLTDGNNFMDRFPSSSFGIAVLHFLIGVASFFRLDILARWVLRENIQGWELPEYPEMVWD